MPRTLDEIESQMGQPIGGASAQPSVVGGRSLDEIEASLGGAEPATTAAAPAATPARSLDEIEAALGGAVSQSDVPAQPQPRSLDEIEALLADPEPTPRPAALTAELPMRPQAAMSTPEELGQAQAGQSMRFRPGEGGLAQQIIGGQAVSTAQQPDLSSTISGEGGIEDQSEFNRQRAKAFAEQVRTDPNASPERKAQAMQMVQSSLESGLATGDAGIAQQRARAVRGAAVGTQSVARGVTFGLSDLAIKKVYDNYGVSMKDVAPENTKEFLLSAGLDGLGSVLTGKALFGGVGGQTGKLAGSGLVLRGGTKALLSKYGKDGLGSLLALRAGMSGATSAVRNSTQVATGEKTILEAVRDTGIDTVSGAIALVPEVAVTAGLKNFAAQIVTGVVSDLALDAAFTDRIEDVGMKQWLIQEIPRMAMDAIFAASDVVDPNFIRSQKSQQAQVKRAVADVRNAFKSRADRAARSDFQDNRQIGFIDEAGNPIDLASILRDVSTELSKEQSVINELDPRIERADPSQRGTSADIAAAERTRRAGVREDAASGLEMQMLLGRSGRAEFGDGATPAPGAVRTEADGSQTISLRSEQGAPMKSFDDLDASRFPAGQDPAPADAQPRTPTATGEGEGEGEPAIRAAKPSRRKPTPAQPSAPRSAVDPKTDELLGTNERGEPIYWNSAAKTHYAISEGRVRTGPDVAGLPNSAIDRLNELASSPQSSTGQKQHVAIYNGKEVTTDSFKQAAQRVADNLATGEHGYVRDTSGKLFEVASDRKTAVPVAEMRTKVQRDIAVLEKRIANAKSANERKVLTERLGDLKAAQPPVDTTPRPIAEDLKAEGQRATQSGAILNPAAGFNGIINRVKNFVTTRPQRVGARQAKSSQDFNDELVRLQSKRASKSLIQIRKDIVGRGHNDDTVADDMMRLLGESDYLINGQRWSPDDVARLSRQELTAMAQASGVAITKGQTNEDIANAIVAAGTDLRIDLPTFKSKYNLSNSQENLLARAITAAKDGANTLDSASRDAGLEQLGGHIGLNEFYSRRMYRYYLMGGKYTPSDASVQAATDVTRTGLDKAVTRLQANASQLQKNGADMVRFLQDNDRAALGALSDAEKDRAHRLKATYDALGQIRTSVSANAAGDVVIGRNQQALLDTADYVIAEMIKPPNRSGGPMTGAGTATDALLKRELDFVFRELRGEIKDPAFVFGASRETQGLLINNFNTMAKLRAQSGLFSDTAMEGAPRGHNVRLSRSQEPGAQVSDADRKRFGMMAGKYVSDAVAKEIGFDMSSDPGRRSAVGKFVSGTYNAIERTSGAIRGVMVLRPAAIMRDAMTNVTGFSGMAGDLDAEYVRAYREALGHVGNLAKADGSASKSAARDFMESLAKDEIFRSGNSSMTAEIQQALGKGKLGQTWDNIMRTRAIIADLPAKYAGYTSRLARLREWYASDVSSGRLTDADLQAKAREHISRVYDNRDAVPMLLKKVARNPLVTDYATFKYSSSRAYVNSMIEAYGDMKNPRVPMKYKGQRMLQMGMSNGIMAAMAIKKHALMAPVATGLAKLFSTMHGEDTPSLAMSDEDTERAVRFMGEDYYAYDPMQTFIDENGKMVRVVWSGSVTPFSIFADLPIGIVDAGESDYARTGPKLRVPNPLGGVGIGPRVIEESDVAANVREEIFGGFETITVKALRNLYRNGHEVWANRVSESEDHAMNMRSDRKAGEAMQKTLTDLISDTTGWFGRVATFDAKQKSVQQFTRSRMSESKDKGGAAVEVPRGFGGRPGRPVEDYFPTRDFRNVLMSGFVPVQVSVYKPEDIRFNLWLKATKLKRKSDERESGEREARRAMSADEKRELDTQDLAVVKQWRDEAKHLLTVTKQDSSERVIADILAKAGYADWQIENVLGIKAPSSSLQSIRPSRPERPRR